MGWTFLFNAPEKRHVIEECTKSGDRVECVRKSVNNNELWTIWVDKISKKKTIVLFLLSKNKGNWGYKDITEAMYPYYFKCPLSFFEEVPEENKEWREDVRAWHAAQKNNKNLLGKICLGSVVKLNGSTPDKFKVTNLDPLVGVSIENGKEYKLIRNRVVEVT